MIDASKYFKVICLDEESVLLHILGNISRQCGSKAGKRACSLDCEMLYSQQMFTEPAVI